MRNKYGAIKTEYKGRMYDSRAEAKFASILDGYKADGSIKEVKEQVAFPLENMEGKKRLRYVADFVVIDKDNNEYVIDVKGRLTPANVVKLSYFRFVYGIEVILIPTIGTKAFNMEWLKL